MREEIKKMCVKKSLKSFLRWFFGDKLTRKIKSLVNRTNRIHLLEEKLEKLVYDVHTIYPPYILQNDSVKQQIRMFREMYKIPLELNTTVFKNDIMFLCTLQHIKDFALQMDLTNHPDENIKAILGLKNDSGYAEKYAVAYYLYLAHGLNSMNMIRKLINHKFGGIGHIDSFLDFGSGYGKFTRFLVLEIDPKKVWVCDRKRYCSQFQVEQFGVNGFVSPQVPEEFQSERKFDVIYACSVFSHLPVDLFLRWLGVLYNLTSENGMLVITVHDISLVAANKNKGFDYRKENEDLSFNEVSDRIVGTEDYGTMYVSETFVSEQLRKIGVRENQYCRYPKGLSHLQDIYVITKKENIFDNSLDFSAFP